MVRQSHEPTVFVIDDDPAVLRSLSALVGIIFPRVEVFSSASEFLDAHGDDRPGCLVLDVAMPGMSGLELHRKLREDKIDLPVVFITGHANVQMAVDAMKAGAVSFLEKPFQEQELWDSIRKALERDETNRSRKARREQAEEKVSLLSSGEREVFNMIVDGKFNKEIAAILGLSVRTVEDRRARLMKKMDIHSIAELVHLALAR